MSDSFTSLIAERLWQLDALILLILALYFIKGFWVGDTKEYNATLSWVISLIAAYPFALRISADIAGPVLPHSIAFWIAYAPVSVMIFLFTLIFIDFIAEEFIYFKKSRPYVAF